MHFSFSTSSLSSPFFVGNPHPEWRITVKHARERCEREFEKDESERELENDGCETGLHESLQPCSRAARKWRENEEMKRKRRGNGERMRKWREIHTLHFLILSLFLPSLSISYIKICHILSQNVKYGTFVANVTKKSTYAIWGNNSGSNLLRGSSASCAGLVMRNDTPR